MVLRSTTYTIGGATVFLTERECGVSYCRNRGTVRAAEGAILCPQHAAQYTYEQQARTREARQRAIHFTDKSRCGCQVYEVCMDCDPATYERILAGLTQPTRRTMEPTQPEMHQFTSGAKSTVKKPEYYLIPLIALQLLAERFGYGKARHGERNYRKGASDPEFITDRVNHLIEHVYNYAEHRKRSDLAAVLCNAAILADLGAFVEEEEKGRGTV